MVKIQVKETFITSLNAQQAGLAPRFSVSLGNEEGGVFGERADGPQGGYVMSVTGENPLLIENEIFQVLVNNSISGSFPRFLNQLLQLVSKNVLEVKQDDGAALTKKQIMTYTAP